jgi:hypothetical protein
MNQSMWPSPSESRSHLRDLAGNLPCKIDTTVIIVPDGVGVSQSGGVTQAVRTSLMGIESGSGAKAVDDVRHTARGETVPIRSPIQSPEEGGVVGEPLPS